MAPKPVCKDLQKWLFEYLSTIVDPYDFVSDLPEFALVSDLEEDTEIEDLTEAQLKAFTKWLKDENKPVYLIQDDPLNAPAYLILHAEAIMPDGTWLIHFTDEAFSDGFKYGMTIEGLALSRHKKNESAVDCSKNLSDERTLFDAVYGFAFEAETRNVLRYENKYGQNAVLFQTDCGVSAYHDGDEEKQVIFPLCSEYNLIFVSDVRHGLSVETEDGEEVSFSSIQKLIKYIEDREGKRAAGLSGPSPKLRRICL